MQTVSLGFLHHVIYFYSSSVLPQRQSWEAQLGRFQMDGVILKCVGFLIYHAEKLQSPEIFLAEKLLVCTGLGPCLHNLFERGEREKFI